MEPINVSGFNKCRRYDMKLEGKVAVVTGAASGMGKAIAKLYGRHGAKVVVSDINLDGAEMVAKSIKDNSGTAVAVKTDISDKKRNRIID